ncbi:MAG: hypothetical protein JW915_12625 [Chitinispirillaceae bacterium]|nr:hypothetical protein [Chitinispirillaceae bacterium]
MRKLSVFLFLAVIISKSAYPLGLGLEFSVDNDIAVGVNLRLTEKFELKPQLGFSIIEDASLFTLNVDGNFYLPQMQNLQHYAGPGISITAFEGNSDFGIDGHYGLRYDFNDIISAFGQIGLGINFDPFALTTFRSGLGLTFYIPMN